MKSLEETILRCIIIIMEGTYHVREFFWVNKKARE